MAWILRCCGSGLGLATAALALIRPLAWEPPYAVGVAIEKAKRQIKKQKLFSYPEMQCVWEKQDSSLILSFYLTIFRAKSSCPNSL